VSRHPARFPGWTVVIGCFLVLVTSSGLGFYGLAVYLNAFSTEKDWPVASISLATTLFFLVGGITGLYVARALARFDVRYVVVGGGLLGGAALAVLGQVDERWQLYVVYGVFAIGWSASGLVPATTVITRWFHVRRSVALSVTSTGLSVGGIVLTPFTKWLLDEVGLAAGTPWLAVIWVVGIVPVTLLMIRPDPRPLGWLPDGERVRHDVPVPTPTGVVFTDAVRTRFFFAVTVGYLFALGSQVGAIQQLVKLIQERAGSDAATLATTVLAGTSVVARLVGGQVTGRIEMMRFTVSLTVLQSVALVLLALVEAEAALFVAIVLFGITIGNILMLQPLLIAEHFGVLDYPRIFSRSQFLTMFGTAAGPLVLGWLHDNAGGYRTAYLAAAVGSLVGAAVLSLGGPVHRPVPVAAATVSTP
jgi:MFS family permease